MSEPNTMMRADQAIRPSRRSPLTFPKRLLAALAAIVVAVTTTLALAAAAPAAEPAKPAPAPLALGGLTVTPGAPAPDTLCQLRVDVTNKGDKIASQLAFAVKVNGQELPVYRHQLFMQRVDPGKTATVRLYNFWSTETGRAAAADRKVRVEVSLIGARWYTIGTENGVEVWTPVGDVAGLPVTASLTAGP